MARRKSKKSARPTKKRSSRGAALSKQRNHIPVALLESRLRKMPGHIKRLENLIAKRKASGE